MKKVIIQWIIKQMFRFIMSQKQHRITMSVVYYYKDEPVKIIRTDFMARHIPWLRTAMNNGPLDPPGNWDHWKIERK